MENNYIKTGYSEWDEYNGGLQTGRVTLICGLPSMGKTSLALNLVNNICFDEDQKCLYFSLKYEEADLRRRMLSICTGYRGNRTPRLMPNKKAALNELNRLSRFSSDFPEWVIKSSSNVKVIDYHVNTVDIRDYCCRKYLTKMVDLVVIDYLALVSVETTNNGISWDLSVLQDLIDISRESHVAMVVLMNGMTLGGTNVYRIPGVDLISMSRKDYFGEDADTIDLDFYVSDAIDHRITLDRDKNWKLKDHKDDPGSNELVLSGVEPTEEDPYSFLKRNWEFIKEQVKSENMISDISYDIWISEMQLKEYKDDIVHISIPEEMHHALKYIINQYKLDFGVTITEILGQKVDVRFVIAED